MRKVELKMDEKQKYEVVKQLTEKGGNKTRAAIKLGCSRSSIYRMINGYKKTGKEFFTHGNKGKEPVNKWSSDERAKIVDLYNKKYWDASYILFSELLLKEDKISASVGLVRDILMGEKILSPYARRNTRHELTRMLKTEYKEASCKKEKREIEEKIACASETHPHRPRCAYFGEMIQMDASIHKWFGTKTSALHAAVDDSTGKIVGAYFDNEETLKGYYNVLYQILVSHGIPYMLFTDRRTVFEYKSKTDRSIENDTYTQFSYALKQLGACIKTSSVPQAKGRIERAFGTLQGRLPVLFRTAGVNTLEQANGFLNHYIKEFNASFALDSDNIPSVFEKQPTKSKINSILAVLTPRVIDSGHAIKFNGKLFLPVSRDGNPVHFRKGNRGLVIQAFDGRLLFSIGQKTYALDEIPVREKSSPEIDFTIRKKPKPKGHIPPLTHPWKLASFEAYVKHQSHHQDDKNPQGA